MCMVMGMGILGELTKLYAYGFLLLFQVLQISWQGEGVTIHILVFWTYGFWDTLILIYFENIL